MSINDKDFRKSILGGRKQRKTKELTTFLLYLHKETFLRYNTLVITKERSDCGNLFHQGTQKIATSD